MTVDELSGKTGYILFHHVDGHYSIERIIGCFSSTSGYDKSEFQTYVPNKDGFSSTIYTFDCDTYDKETGRIFCSRRHGWLHIANYDDVWCMGLNNDSLRILKRTAYNSLHDVRNAIYSLSTHELSNEIRGLTKEVKRLTLAMDEMKHLYHQLSWIP